MPMNVFLFGKIDGIGIDSLLSVLMVLSFEALLIGHRGYLLWRLALSQSSLYLVFGLSAASSSGFSEDSFLMSLVLH